MTDPIATEPVILDRVQSSLAVFSKVNEGLAKLSESYKGVVYEVQKKEGMLAAREARRAIRAPRLEVEEIRVAEKRYFLDAGRAIDAEAKRITKVLSSLEDPIDAQIKGEEERIEREREARIEAERKRVAEIRARIDGIRRWPENTSGGSSSHIATLLKAAEATAIDDSYGEFREEAEAALFRSVDSLRTLHSMACQQEAEARRLAAERERQAQEQADRERDRRAEEEKLALARAEFERQQSEARAREQAERDRIAAEEQAQRERLAAERRQQEHEATERRRVEDEARAAEESRLAAERAAFEEERRTFELAKKESERPFVVAVDESNGADITTMAVKQGDTMYVANELEIIFAVAQHFGVSGAVALEWLQGVPWAKVKL